MVIVVGNSLESGGEPLSEFVRDELAGSRIVVKFLKAAKCSITC